MFCIHYDITAHPTIFLIQLISHTMNTIYKHTIRRVFGCVLLSTLPLGVMAQNVRVIKSDGTIKMYDGSKQNIKVAPVPTVNTNDKVKTGSTLYDNLQALGNYTTYLRLIDSFGGIKRAFENKYTDDERKNMGFIDTLTVFAPNDEAFARFFAHNVWTDQQGNTISSYEQLSDSQKLSLIYMSYIPGFVTANNLHSNSNITANLRLYAWGYDRQFNLVPYKHTGGTDINTFWPGDNSNIDYAKELNQHIMDGVWIGYGTVGDNTEGAFAYRGGTMIWNSDYWQYNGLSHDDLVFVGAADTEGSEHIKIGNAHIIQPNQRCKNGYLHLVDEVVVPQPNLMCALAQARWGDKCSLASSLVQRFNYLKYDPEYTSLKSMLFDDSDSAMTIRNSLLDRVVTTTQTPAIILPTDEALKAFLLASDNPLWQCGINEDNYYDKLMSLPREVLQPFVKEWFRTSFTDVLPSRYSNMRSAKGHQLLAGVTTPEAYKLAVQQVIPAVDGIIVVVDAVPNAEDLRNELTFVKLAGQVAGAALTANDRYEYNTNAAPFSTDYQREMHNKSFTMFVPTDEGLKQYGLVDPMSMASNNRASWRYWSLTPDSISSSGNGQIAVAARAYRYDYNKVRNAETDRPLGVSFSNSANDGANVNYGPTKRQLLTDMLDQHIVLQDLDSMLNNLRHWYLSRSGMPIYMKEHTNTNIVVNGGMQIDLNERDAADKHDCTLQFVGQNNTGTSVFIDRPIQPTTQNVYQRLQSNDAFSMFFDCANALNGAYDLKNQLFDIETSEALNRKYTIFADFSGSYARYGNANTMLVNFFHNFNYTIFVPTNEGMQKAIAEGLPTIESIEQFVEESLDDNGQLPDDKREQAQARYLTLLNFLKYHFCDKSYFLEPDLESGDTEQTTTACIDASNQQALTADINSGNGMLMVRDASNRYKAVKPDLANIIARDAEFNNDPTRARYILSASNVVLHGIDNADYLLFDNTLNGDFTRAWRTPSAARKFVKKYGK